MPENTSDRAEYFARLDTAWFRTHIASVLGNLSAGCAKKFASVHPNATVSAASALDLMVSRTNSVNVINANNGGGVINMGNQYAAGYAVSTEDYSMSASDYLARATLPGTTTSALTVGSSAILLGSGYFSQSPQDQGLTLLHEMLHVSGLGRGDVGLAQSLGIAGSSGLTVGNPGDGVQASGLITDFLKNDCPN